MTKRAPFPRIEVTCEGEPMTQAELNAWCRLVLKGAARVIRDDPATSPEMARMIEEVFDLERRP